jgi:hypothetical protein
MVPPVQGRARIINRTGAVLCFRMDCLLTKTLLPFKLCPYMNSVILRPSVNAIQVFKAVFRQ